MSLYTQQSKNIHKTWLLMGLFFIVVIAIGWLFSQVYGNPGFVYIAVIFSLFMNFFSYWYSDKVALAMAGARPIQREENLELYRIVENLCITAGLKVPKIYIINDPSPNAFATGRNQEHAAMAVTSGLLEMMNKNELEGVIAHELSHVGNKDILISTVVVVLVGFIALLSDFFLRMQFFRGGRRSDREEGQGQAIMMLIGVALAILAPIAATLIQLAISRKREFLADTDGALLTRYPEGLASALVKISQYPTPLRRVNKATAHLYIDSPLKGKHGASWLAKLFMTHPPVEERIMALRGMNV